MGFFKTATTCILCGKEGIGLMAGAKLATNEKICDTCLAKQLHLSPGYTKDIVKRSSMQQIKDRIESVKKDLSENQKRYEKFVPTTKIYNYIWFDDEHKWFVIPRIAFKDRIKNCYIFKYEEIVGYEILQIEPKKEVCTSLKVKLTTRNADYPILFLTIIRTETKKEKFEYRVYQETVQMITSKLQIILDQLEREQGIMKDNTNSPFSAADEIKKYKELLDIGAITQEEFDKKKEELLRLI